ncbi:MAG: hypothetical protein DMG26_06795 [Acidobacteria bacterium]|nr:MAG: hypothetical protein DMG25_06045 [Acidobacteriota bacterium]PYV04744.1 MAG: hypothetical protein DMG26_06795 [Acidobacteriota bacterium]
MATLEERVALLEAKLGPLSDSILVHGIMQARTERNLADVSDRMKELAENQGVLLKNQVDLQHALESMRVAVDSLILTVDRFIKGQQKNGGT